MPDELLFPELQYTFRYSYTLVGTLHVLVEINMNQKPAVNAH